MSSYRKNKVKVIAESVMWLPGFGPNEDPLEVLGVAGAVMVPVVVMAKPAVSIGPNCWPLIDASTLDGLSGDISKFDANVAAIRVLSQIEAETRVPTLEERIQLNRYTGWGGLAKVFNLNQKEEDWGIRREQLQSLLTDDEYKDAEASTLNAHFTPPTVISALWDLVERLGFTGGRIIEPAGGVGYFLAHMPQHLVSASHVNTVEPDRVSARILRALYGSHGVRVHESGFEACSFPDGYFDLAISNVPFGDYQVPELRNVPYANYLIHDYFFAKALDVVRPGGLVVFITSTGTMDKGNDRVRQYIASKANLLGAIRLPAGTFQQVAGTGVVTDIMILQKPEMGRSVEPSTQWMGLCKMGQEYRWGRQDSIFVNRYWQHHPENVIGKLVSQKGRFGVEAGCTFDGDFPDALSACVAKFPLNVYQPLVRVAAEPIRQRISLPTGEQTRPGFLLIDGVVYESDGINTTVVGAPTKTLERIAAMCSIRDAVRKLIKAQVMSDDDGVVESYRVALNVTYSRFVQSFGFINLKANQRAFKSDPDYPLLLSLEYWDDETETAQPAEIFTRRTVKMYRQVEHCDTAADALVVCIAECGVVRPSRIAQLVSGIEAEVMDTLESDGCVYLDPETATWESADQYLSGDVRKKLAQARLASNRFHANVEALEKVLPPDLQPSEIGARIGSTWIPASVYVEFLNETFNSTKNKVEYSSQVGTWDVVEDYSIRYSVAATQDFGTSRINAAELFVLALNQRVPEVRDKDPDGKYYINKIETIAAREKQQNLKDKFQEWVWSDTDRAVKLVRIYNDTFNSVVRRNFDGSHMPLPGYSQVVNLHKHQQDGIWRIVASNRNCLLGHTVGAGKTLTMICAGMELRRLGKASKPMYVVPNHMLFQFAAEFLRAYPTANILMASKDDLVGDKRRVLMSRIATGDWDAVLVTHASFERLSMSQDFMEDYIQAEIDNIESAIRSSSNERNNRIVKELARAKKVWSSKLEKLQARTKKDDVLTFEELGIDYLFVDEAHLFKNLWRFTKMSRIAGLPTSNSERAYDMFVKTRHVMEKHGGLSGVVFATGTFVANSMAEMWVMQRYLQDHSLQNMQINMFDSWAANFGETVTALELAPDGSGFRMQTRFARFINMPELMGMFAEVADIRTKEMLNLPVPKDIKETIVVEATPELKEYVKSLVERADRIRGGRVTPSEDNMLSITNDGRNAALDLRLVGATFAKDCDGKIAFCANQVVKIWRKSCESRGTQIVFCDTGTPTGNASLNVYAALLEELVKHGIPKQEVAFIHDYDSDSAKELLFRKVREGRVRVVVGSTQKMGVGTNVQDRLIALHHLDAPWRPADLEQREGRIVRQGNQNDTVYIFRYVTEGSFDSYVWQTLETKARFIAQVMQGDTSLRTVEDVELAALSYAEVKALASGNPLVLEKAGVDTELSKLTMLRTQWERTQWANRHELAALPRQIETCNKLNEQGRTDIARRNASQGKPFEMLVDGIRYNDPSLAGHALQKATAKMERWEARHVGLWKGFSLIGGLDRDSRKAITVKGAAEYQSGVPMDSSMVCPVLDEMLNHIEVLIVDREKHLSLLENRLVEVRGAINRPFDKEARMRWLMERQREIEGALDMTKNDTQAVDEALAEVA